MSDLELWIRRCHAVFEASVHHVFTDSAKAQAKTLWGDLRVWAQNNGVFSVTGGLEERIAEAANLSPPSNALPWKEGFIRAIQRTTIWLIHGEKRQRTKIIYQRLVHLST